MQQLQEQATTGDITENERIRIRPASTGDMGFVVDCISSTAEWYKPFVDEADMENHEVDLNWAKENFQQREFYVGQLGKARFGTITLQEFGHYTYLGYVFLHESMVGRGLGHKLLDFARDESQRRDKKGMVLLAHPDATWAVRAYEKYGFQCIAQNSAEVLSWNDGMIGPYYEQGFSLYEYAIPQSSFLKKAA